MSMESPGLKSRLGQGKMAGRGRRRRRRRLRGHSKGGLHWELELGWFWGWDWPGLVLGLGNLSQQVSPGPANNLRLFEPSTADPFSDRREPGRAWPAPTMAPVPSISQATAPAPSISRLSSPANHQWKFGFPSCLLLAIIFVTNFYAKIGFLCLVGLERCVGVLWPLLWRTWHSPQLAAQVSLAWWVFVVTLSTVGRYFLLFDPNYNETLCSEAFPPGRRYILFKISTAPLTFFGPLLFVSVSYGIILRELRRVAFLATRRQIFACVFLTIMTFFLVLGPNQGVSVYRFISLQSVNNTCGEKCLCYVEEKLVSPQNVTWCLMVLGNILDPLVYILPTYFQQGKEDSGQVSSHPAQGSIPPASLVPWLLQAQMGQAQATGRLKNQAPNLGTEEAEAVPLRVFPGTEEEWQSGQLRDFPSLSVTL
ncbi:LOW QUALITY PROTEIN: fMet-Leu-Phe receptor-like [Tachyglossus aculeatus]|uniref:LOW QUALITY PROTEIN: fMet-Leu-Phe receptor-like n=1 Tax=Tachyglossus aculeatus TaxID=9261 RepID=UPI0018F2B672|nr:LOW QUALITY PROTEIN: fMet-Leu-Phe receptor-like [Tachyglossus aculeatus]